MKGTWVKTEESGTRLDDASARGFKWKIFNQDLNEQFWQFWQVWRAELALAPSPLV